MRVRTNLESIARLQSDLRAAGLVFGSIFVSGDLSGGDLMLLRDDGTEDAELLDDPRVAAVVGAHVPDAEPADPVYGADEPAKDLRPQAAQIVQQARAYLGVATPTLPQTAAAVKLIIRVLLFIIRRQLVPPRPPEPPPMMLPPMLLALMGDAVDDQAEQHAVEVAPSLLDLIGIAARQRGVSDADIAAAVVYMAERLARDTVDQEQPGAAATD